MSEQVRELHEVPPYQMTVEERDDDRRGAGYSARCAYWESLTVEDIYGPAKADEQPARLEVAS